MTTWMERAKAHFLQERQEQADKTDESGVMSVSSVCSRPAYEKSKGVSSVSSAHSWHSYEKQCFSEEGGSVGFEGTAPGAFEEDQSGDPAPAWLARKGLTRQYAKRVMRMLEQRTAFDDRKSCAECASYFAGRCVKRMQPVGDADDIAFVLHRCAGFALDPMSEVTHDE